MGEDNGYRGARIGVRGLITFILAVTAVFAVPMAIDFFIHPIWPR